MAKLVNMMKEAEPADEKQSAMPEDSGEPRYPWGLQLHLNDESLEKLGVDKLPAGGSEFLLTAKVRVVGQQEYESNDADGVTRSVDLQITDMALDAAPAEKSISDRLYKPAQDDAD